MQNPSNPTVWLIAHERPDPERLVMRECESEAAAAEELDEALSAHRNRGLNVDPRQWDGRLEVRYQVFDDAGWFATYWLSHRASPIDGILTAVGSPAEPRKSHVMIPRDR
jgi:hypothetical protein